jgi:phosphoenolpyruvate-protein kinase (PTS system EI component)
MIEVPRGAITADEIATEVQFNYHIIMKFYQAQFFSFGTNDLT